MQTLTDCVLNSFLTEIKALKPGNVSHYAAGHDMTVEDFIESAKVVSPVLTDKDLSVGERILQSVQVTANTVACNTNLGMLLLFAPLVQAAEMTNLNESLQSQLATVLNSLDNEDSMNIMAAIKLAAPGGLGKSRQYDVNELPDVAILEAMRAAQHRDTIALQYVTHFHDIFDLGLNTIKDYILRWNRVEWAAVMCFMHYLGKYPDSHIIRKHGLECARRIQRQSQTYRTALAREENPESMQNQLLQWDSDLKEAGINPGTSADLTAASILVYYLVNNNL